MNTGRENAPADRAIRIAIVGGGLSGLSAAHRLTELAAAANRPLAVTLFEAASRLGGAIATVRENGYLIERGADSFLTSKPAVVQLAERLGIAERLIPTNDRYRKALVLFRGKPYCVPEGFNLMQPSAFWPIVKTPLLSPAGKLRMLRELWIKPRSGSGQDDESLESFVTRRLGRQAFDRLVQPLVSGIYTADPAKLSLAATLPRFLDMEREHGGLIRAARKSAAPAERKSSGARYGLFAGFQDGMEELLATLRNRLAGKVTVRLASRVERLPRTERGWEITPTGQPAVEPFDAVILTLPTYHSAALLEPVDAELADLLRRIPYASSAVVATGHRLDRVKHPLNAFGLVIPAIENRDILAVSFGSRKFAGRAPEGKVLLRTFVGGAMRPDLIQRSDEELITLVRSELAAILGVQGEPDVVLVSRYERAMPQYHVGHLQLIRQIEAAQARLPGLELVGSAYRGVGMPDVVADAERAAETLFNAVA